MCIQEKGSVVQARTAARKIKGGTLTDCIEKRRVLECQAPVVFFLEFLVSLSDSNKFVIKN